MAGLFGSLIKWGLNDRPPGVTRLPELDLGKEAQKAVTESINLLPDVQKLQSSQADYWRGESRKNIEQYAPWFNTASDIIGKNAIAWAKGELSPEEESYIARKTQAANIGGGYGWAPAGRAATVRNLGLRQMDVMNQGASTAANWLNIGRSLFAPALQDYTSRYLPTTAEQASFDVGERNAQWQNTNLRKQFAYATDPIRGVYQGIENLGDTVGSALSIYAGGFGGGIGSLGGLMGMAGSGDTQGGVNALNWIYNPQSSPAPYGTTTTNWASYAPGYTQPSSQTNPFFGPENWGKL